MKQSFLVKGRSTSTLPKRLNCMVALVGLTILLLNHNCRGQTINNVDNIIMHKHVNNIIPRLGIGVSRHFISEFGIAYMRSDFKDHKELGLNTINIIYYFSFETMTPYKNPNVYGYKIGVESINLGHITSAGGIEVGYFQKDTLTSFVVTPRVGIPLMNGTLAYGFSFYFNRDMKSEIGSHNITLTYSFNRKSDKVFHSMLTKNNSRHRN